MKKLLHFTADWCQPCKKIKPIVANFIDSNSDIEYIQIDIDKDFDIASEHNVLSIPTLVAFDNDKEIGRHVGLASSEDIERLLK